MFKGEVFLVAIFSVVSVFIIGFLNESVGWWAALLGVGVAVYIFVKYIAKKIGL